MREVQLELCRDDRRKDVELFLEMRGDPTMRFARGGHFASLAEPSKRG